MNLTPKIMETMQTGMAQKILIVPKSPMLLRIGRITSPLDPYTVSPQDVKDTLSGLATIANYQIVVGSGKISNGTFTLSTHDVGRLRVNFIIQRGTPVIFVERVPSQIPSINERIPQVEVKRRLVGLLEAETGIILFTGNDAEETAEVVYAVLKNINDNENKILCTVEKPLRYILNNKKSVVIQREVGVDVDSVAHGINQSSFLKADILYISDIPDKKSLDELIQVANKRTLCLVMFPSWSPSLAIKSLQHLHGSPDLFSQVVKELLLGVIHLGEKGAMTLYTQEDKEALLHGA